MIGDGIGMIPVPLSCRPDMTSRASTSIRPLAAALMVLAAGCVLQFNLLTALYAGLLSFLLTRMASARLAALFGHRANMVAVAGLIGTGILILFGLVLMIISMAGSPGLSVPDLLAKMAEILESFRNLLPAQYADLLPSGVDEIRSMAATYLRGHGAELQGRGAHVGVALVHILVGLIIGAMVAVRDHRPDASHGPLAVRLGEHVGRLATAFRRVVFAQVRISAINTAITAIYLLGVLPLFNVHLPFTKTLLLLTFVFGLLPVIGNLLSNTAIVIISLGQSLPLALGSLIFLVSVHKLEYFLNARIAGSRVNACAWEMLVAMVSFEAVFGIAGLVAAPVFYAWIKSELRAEGLV